MALKEKRSVQNILSIELPFCEYPSSKLQAPEEFKRLKDDLKDSKNECDNRKKCEWRFTGEVEFKTNECTSNLRTVSWFQFLTVPAR